MSGIRNRPELGAPPLLSFLTPSHAISEHYQTTPTDSFVSSLNGSIPRPTVPSSTSSFPGTPKERAWADVTTRRDSALSTTSATDGEVELPRELLTVLGSQFQVSDHDDLMVHMDTASGTLPTLESNLRARVLALEKEVSELQEMNEQLYQDKRANEKLVCDKIADTIIANTQLKKAFESLQLEEDKTRQARLAKEEADERARLAEESADKRVRLLEKEIKKSYREKIAAHEQFMNSSSFKVLGKRIKEMDVEFERNNR